MKKLSKERIYEFAYAFADFTYKHNIADDERQDYLEGDDSNLFELLELNQEVFMRYLFEKAWYIDDNEMDNIERSSDFFIGEIINEAVEQLRKMLAEK